MNYEQALQFIHESCKFGTKLGLERINAILEALGHPERQFRVIHVAGTNGKGSTLAMFDAILRESGYKTARFNSPHLSSYRERFLINGAMISKTELAELVSTIHPVLEKVGETLGPPTEFELGTAVAFLHFAQQQVDVAIIEVGMGGRFDATNVVQPILSVITHIALDHQEYLGNSLREIAFEKAGIIKPGIPVVIGRQEPDISEYFKEIVMERLAPYSFVETIATQSISVTEEGTEFQARNTCFGDIQLRLGLIGEHQIMNCLNVLAGIAVLNQNGFQITKQNTLNGLRNTIWPGRFERIKSVGPLKLYLDGAHNPDGAKAVVNTIRQIYPEQKVDLLIGILNNRPIAEMAEIFAPVTRKVITTQVPDPKSTDANTLAAVFEKLGISVVVEPDPQNALDLLLKSDQTVAFATGSFYLIGFLRSILLQIGD